MITCAVFVVSLLFGISGCDCKTVSVIVKHRQEFGTHDVDDKEYIQLPDIHERLLKLQDATKYITKFQIPEEDNKHDITSVIDVIKNGINSKLKRKKQKARQKTGPKIKDNNFDNEVDKYFGSINIIKSDKVNEMNDKTAEESSNDNKDDNTSDREIRHLHDSVVDIDDEECSIDNLACLNKLYGQSGTEQTKLKILLSKSHKRNRKKRSAQEQWKNSLPGSKQANTRDDTEPDIWEEVTDKDLEQAKLNRYRQTMEYIGLTLLSAVLFIFIGICFLRDPIACIFAFGTGCPCCLICCPCIRSFTDKYLDSKRIVREQMNTYMPGIIVNDDGSLDYYEPTAEELDVLMEIIDEISG